MELKVLKKVLRYIKSEKKHIRASIDMLYELQGNFIEKKRKNNRRHHIKKNYQK